MSASSPEGAFHLLTADDDLAHPYVYGGLVAVCGEAMTRSSLPPSCYPPGESAGRDPRYCPECVREAARWSAEARGRASGFEVKTGARRATLSGLAEFAKAFHPDRTLLIGADGIPLAGFLSEPAESWL